MEGSNANGKAVVNLTRGSDDGESATIAFLVGTAALGKGKQVVTFLTKEAVHLALPGNADAIEVEGIPPLSRLFEQYREGGGELLVCPICFDARGLDADALVENAKLGGGTPLWEWIGEGATVFSY